jgi:hypothetical protein
MEDLSWRQLLNIIDTVRGSSQKCTIRVLDTVFVDSTGEGSGDNAILWYFTTKNGTISKKKKDKCSLTAVCDRFSRFSLANPNNTGNIVCTIVSANGSRTYLDQTEMNSLINSQHFGMSNDTFLQVYLRPYEGSAHVIRAICTIEETGRNKVKVFSENIVGPGGLQGREQSELSIEAKDQANYFCHELSNFFLTGEYKLKEFEL